MKKTVEEKRKLEQKISALMIQVYCRGNHHSKKELCPQCAQLAEYTRQRIAHCPRMAEKTFCSACPSPCYHPERQAQIREVMRYAGPRMLLDHPIVALRHCYVKKSEHAKEK